MSAYKEWRTLRRGVATLYNYYQTKVKLVIAISGKKFSDLEEDSEEKGPEIFESFTAYQYIEFLYDQIIRIYWNV